MSTKHVGQAFKDVKKARKEAKKGDRLPILTSILGKDAVDSWESSFADDDLDDDEDAAQPLESAADLEGER